MIIEVVAGCVTICFVATLRFAKWASERCTQEDARADPIHARLTAVRSYMRTLQDLMSRLAHNNVRTVDEKAIKDRRLRELVVEIERLSQLEAKILRGEA